MLIAFIIIYLICFLGILKWKRKLLMHPLFWLFFAYTIIIGLYLCAGILYGNQISSEVWFYIIGMFLLFILFFRLGEKIKFNGGNKNTIDERINLKPYTLIGLTGSVLWVFDLFRLNKITLGMRINNFSISFIGTIGFTLLTISLITWLFEFSYAIEDNRLPRLSGIISTILYLMVSVLTAGRQNILIWVITTMIIFFYGIKKKSYKYTKKILVVMVILIIAIAFYQVLIAETRSGVSGLDRKVTLYEYMYNSDTSEETVEFCEKFGIFDSSGIEMLYYYSHEIPMFAMFYENYNAEPLYGAYEFSYIARRLPGFLELDTSYIWGDIEQFSTRYSVYDHVWRTCLGSFIIDFGRIGTGFFVAVLGFLTGYAYKLWRSKENTFRLVKQAVICTGIAFSIQYSPFQEQGWAYALYWLGIIWLCELYKRRKQN